jgi:hypothetical protein
LSEGRLVLNQKLHNLVLQHKEKKVLILVQTNNHSTLKLSNGENSNLVDHIKRVMPDFEVVIFRNSFLNKEKLQINLKNNNLE